MSYNSDFNLDDVLRQIGKVAANYKEGSPDDEALRVAAVALLFLRDIAKLDEYRAYFRDFFTPVDEAVTLSHTFATKDEAKAWLPSATSGQIVKIGDVKHVVAQGDNGLLLVPTYFPSDFKE